MAKPPPSPPSSDIDGVHQDRRPQNHPANADPAEQEESARRARDSIGRPRDGTESGRG